MTLAQWLLWVFEWRKGGRAGGRPRPEGEGRNKRGQSGFKSPRNKSCRRRSGVDLNCPPLPSRASPHNYVSPDARWNDANVHRFNDVERSEVKLLPAWKNSSLQCPTIRFQRDKCAMTTAAAGDCKCWAKFDRGRIITFIWATTTAKIW